METMTGRKEEKKLLEDLMKTNSSELAAIYGRRRIGKTFLVRNVYRKELVFEFSGIHDASLPSQLKNFSNAFADATGSKIPVAVPDTWMDAFRLLEQWLAGKKRKSKQVLFFDEFPWICTPRSGFLDAFGHFWNQFVSKRNDLVIVICGSAASWIIKHVLRSKGSLHNRVTQEIRLLPFTLGEAEAYLQSRNIIVDRYQLLQLYIAMGGVPEYLRHVSPGQSATQAINHLCFSKDGFLTKEFKNLYHALFDDAVNHMAVIKALATRPSGLTRNEIIDACGLSSGGGTTTILDELAECGFIMDYVPFNNQVKESIYRLTDEYSLFYLKFIEPQKSYGKDIWQRISAGQSWRSWAGFAFESICWKHIAQIKNALGIPQLITSESIWRFSGTSSQKGAQIDLLIDRNDQTINLCEMKFSTAEYVIDKNCATELNQKRTVFQQESGTRKTIFVTMITTFGVKQNAWYSGQVQNELTMNDLFA